MTLQFEGVGFSSGTGAGGKTGTVVLVAMGSQPSTPYTVGSKWFYNGKIYTATTTTATDGGVVPSYNTAYLYNGTYYYWDGSALQGADESNLVHISGTETITGDKTFSGSVALGDNASAQTKPTSDTSDAVATTKFVKDFAEDGEWQKPADWIDIRSGALDNSIYFLVAHSKPVLADGVYSIAEHKNWSFLIEVSTGSNTYDVFVDGIKVATTASGTATTINWATLYNNNTIKSGYDIASPGSGNYTTHIIRVTPTVATDTILGVRANVVTGETEGQGVLWVHFELSNAIKINRLVGSTATTTRNLLCQAITAKNDKIKYVITQGSNVTGLYSLAAYASALVKIPILEAETNERVGDVSLAFNSVKTKIIVKNNSEKMVIGHIHNFKGEYFETENPVKFHSGVSGTTNASGATNLKKLPAISTKEKGTALIMGRLDSIEETFIDESFNDKRTVLQIFGESGYQTNLVGLIVSNSAPFNYATAPQLSVAYTNMNRDALVRLFNSMPTVSDSQEIDVTGAIGAGDLTAEDLAIATGKGWTVTR